MDVQYTVVCKSLLLSLAYWFQVSHDDAHGMHFQQSTADVHGTSQHYTNLQLFTCMTIGVVLSGPHSRVMALDCVVHALLPEADCSSAAKVCGYNFMTRAGCPW